MADALPDPVVVNPFRCSACGAAAVPGARACPYCGAPNAPASRPLDCVHCGYALEGLDPNAPCPECGAPGALRQLILHGIPAARSSLGLWRILTIVALVLFASFGPQLLLIIGLQFGSWTTSLVILAAVLLFVIWFVASAPKAASGPARIVFTGGCLVVVPTSSLTPLGDHAKRLVIPFTGLERADLTRVGPFWAKLRIRDARHAAIFRAGIRCPQALDPLVLQTIHEVIAERLPSTPNPTPNPTASSAPNPPSNPAH